jgi:hypothetical protein
VRLNQYGSGSRDFRGTDGLLRESADDGDASFSLAEPHNFEGELHTHMSTGHRPLSEVFGGRTQELRDFWRAPTRQLRHTLGF